MKIFYFTGTGNSYYVARRMAKTFSMNEITRITAKMDEPSKIINNNTVCIVTPLYFGGLPVIVEKFIHDLDLESTKDVLLMVTRNFAPSWIDEQIKDILGNRLKGLYYINMPGNYLFEYNPPGKEKANRKLEKADITIDKIADDIKSGNLTIKKYDIFSKTFFKKFYDYYKKRVLPVTDKKFKILGNCNACGLCKKVCPLDNIQIADKKPKWLGHCQECTACIHSCPKQAIQHGSKTVKRNRYIHPQIGTNELVIK